MKKIFLYDTTLRDGAQTEGISLSLDDKLRITAELDRSGIHYVEGGWPGSNPKDINYFEQVKKMNLKTAVVTAFGSTRRAKINPADDYNLQTLLKAGTKAITIFGKTWDLHVTDVFKVSLKENLSMISDSVAHLKAGKREVIYDAEHFFDGFKANPDYALQSLRAAADAGADVIVLCDTNGGAMPQEVAYAMKMISSEIKTPLGIHCHNDCGLAVANSIEAVKQGAIQVQGTINGIGERCGNADLISVAPVLKYKLGYAVLSDAKFKKWRHLSRYVAEICNVPLQMNQPFVGVSAFAHKGGVHIDAMVKNAKTYEHMDPALLGNERKYLVSELSGKTNILAKAKLFDLDLSKDSDETREILKQIRVLEQDGYQFEAAEASFELLVKKLTGRHRKFFDILGFNVTDARILGSEIISWATVHIKVGDIEEHTAASGEGPVNALDLALRKSLKRFYPQIESIHLADYKVRVVNTESGTGARVRVFIEFHDADSVWQTVGVSANIIEASLEALTDAIEYRLQKK